MATKQPYLSASEHHRFDICPVKCPRVRTRISSLADFFGVISSTITRDGSFWFRGHSRAQYGLIPSALRYTTYQERIRALGLLPEFKRVAEFKLQRPPLESEELKWVQLAQHYGIPTRLLDWTENASIALFFACLEFHFDGIVFVLNPVDLNRISYPQKPRILDSHVDAEEILKYLKQDPKKLTRGKTPIAINPVWNSDRLMVQRGVFTLHGATFGFDGARVPSLVGVPILRDYKEQLLLELERVGIDEMTIFPELEHSCKHLKRKARLSAWE